MFLNLRIALLYFLHADVDIFLEIFLFVACKLSWQLPVAYLLMNDSDNTTLQIRSFVPWLNGGINIFGYDIFGVCINI